MMLLSFRSIYIFLIGTILCFYSCARPDEVIPVDCHDLLISPVADQEFLADTRGFIPLTVLAKQLNKIKFTIVDGPNFISLSTSQRGRAILTVDPSTKDVGRHKVKIEVNDGSRMGCTSFEIQIERIDETTRIIHCDPSQTGIGNGTEENPYGSLDKVMASSFSPQPNDLILLHKGNHKDVILKGSSYTIAAKQGHHVTLTSLQVLNAHNLTIKGLEVKPANDNGDHNQYLVFIDSTCQNMDFSNNIVMSTNNSDTWSQNDWDERASRGVKCMADNSIIANNLIQNIFHGIKTEGKNITVDYNHVDRFGGDAIRNTGSNNQYRYNCLTNATVDDYYDKDGNHDDLFQSWTFDKAVDSILLANNIMISCLDTLMPQRAKIVQGLVCFDGFETNWVVRGNTIVTDHPHGIALYGAKNCAVYENTVLKNPHDLYQYESDPWIMINNHKDGRKSKNNIVRNNTTSSLNIVADDVEVTENLIIDTLSKQKLNNYYEWDFRIKE